MCVHAEISVLKLALHVVVTKPLRINVLILEKLKVSKPFCLSVFLSLSLSLSACLREAPTGRNFLKFDTEDVYKNLSEIYLVRSVCINNETRLLSSSCPDRLSYCLSLSLSLCLHVYAKRPLDGISWNLTLRTSIKICQKYIWLKSG